MGGGEGWRAVFCLGILSREGGSLASEFGGSFSRVDLAGFHGKTFWLILFGGSVWHIHLEGFQSNEKDMLLSKKRKEKKYTSVNL